MSYSQQIIIRFIFLLFNNEKQTDTLTDKVSLEKQENIKNEKPQQKISEPVVNKKSNNKNKKKNDKKIENLQYDNLKIYSLGGLGVVGMNMYVVEQNEELIIIETLAPYIYQDGELIQYARVIIGSEIKEAKQNNEIKEETAAEPAKVQVAQPKKNVPNKKKSNNKSKKKKKKNKKKSKR